MKAPLGYFDNYASGLLRNRIDGAAADTETLLAHNLADISGTVRNLTIKGEINGNGGYNGAVATKSTGGASFEGITVNAKLYGGTETGSLAGYVASGNTIAYNCVNYSDVSATSQAGGFFGSVEEEGFTELLIRWFQFGAFCPVLRMHGDRGPHDIPNLSDLDYGGGFSATGRPNEIWSYGEEAYEIMKKYLDIRLGMKDYIKSIMDETSENGSPVIRTMFYEFPDDEKCWSIDDQYMFGDKYLVAPVLYKGMAEREVYLPQGTWKSIHDGSVYNGGQTIIVETPLEIMPVFEKI